MEFRLLHSIGSYLAGNDSSHPDRFPRPTPRWSGKSHGELHAGVAASQRRRIALVQSGAYASLLEVAQAERRAAQRNGWQGYEADYLTDLLKKGLRRLRGGRPIVLFSDIPIHDLSPDYR